VKVVIDTHVRLYGAPADVRKRWQDRCTLDNPKHAASARFTKNHRPAYGVPKKILLWEIGNDGALVLPRGIMGEIEREYEGCVEIRRAMSFPQAEMGTTLAFDPRPVQRLASAAAIEAESGTIVAPTGTGKTMIAMQIIHALQTPALFLVHSTVLRDQARARIRTFLGYEPGIIGDGEWSPRDITIGMLQTLVSRGPCDLVDRFGLVIQDEAHIAPAQTFRRVVAMFSARYRLGLTATPARGDHLETILFDVIGPVVYQIPGVSLPLRATSVWTRWAPEKMPIRAKPKPKKDAGLILTNDDDDRQDVDFVALINAMVADEARNAVILDTILREHRAASLVLSERVEHCRVLTSALSAAGLSVVMLAGDPTQAQRDDAIGGMAEGRYDVLVSTPGMVGTGFDCPRLDTLFLTCPHSDPTKTTQLAGRVTREYEGKLFGRVYDFVDPVGMLEHMWWTRRKTYRTLAAG
jgi:superfamily II DNA or RNA helicase